MTPIRLLSPSSRLRSRLGCLFLALTTLVPAFGQQSQAVPPDHQGGGNHRLQHATKVPFKRGPFGPDGKVYQVVPKPVTVFPNEIETPEIEQGRALADSGIFTLTTKKASASLSSQQLSLLHWNPSKLNISENPLLDLELLKQALKPANIKNKKILDSSDPQLGPDFSGIGATGFSPPDGGVAAGPIQVLEVVNASINVYDKNGSLLSSQTLNNFFSSLGLRVPTSFSTLRSITTSSPPGSGYWRLPKTIIPTDRTCWLQFRRPAM